MKALVLITIINNDEKTITMVTKQNQKNPPWLKYFASDLKFLRENNIHQTVIYSKQIRFSNNSYCRDY